MQRMILRIVGRFPEMTAGELARLLHVHPSTLTAPLHRLVRSGMVVRKADAEDGRRARLSLAPEGQEINVIRSGTIEAAVRKALAEMPEEKLEAAREVLAHLARALEAEE
jgi:DNA-binding MarR family transcriptional regulator